MDEDPIGQGGAVIGERGRSTTNTLFEFMIISPVFVSSELNKQHHWSTSHQTFPGMGSPPDHYTIQWSGPKSNIKVPLDLGFLQ